MSTSGKISADDKTPSRDPVRAFRTCEKAFDIVSGHQANRLIVNAASALSFSSSVHGLYSHALLARRIEGAVRSQPKTQVRLSWPALGQCRAADRKRSDGMCIRDRLRL